MGYRQRSPRAWVRHQLTPWFVIVRKTEQGFPGGSVVKESVCQCRRYQLSLIAGSEKSPGEGNGDPFQYSCLENPMGKGVWWATVHGVVKRDMTEHTHTHTHTHTQASWVLSKEP